MEGELEMGVWVWSSEPREVVAGIQVWLWVDSVDGEDRAGGREAMVAGVPGAEYWRGESHTERGFSTRQLRAHPEP